MRIFTFSLFWIVFLVSVVPAADFWPIGIESTYEYIDDEGRVLEVTYLACGSRESQYYSPTVYILHDLTYVGSDGDVYLSDTIRILQDPTGVNLFYRLNPPVKLLDLPLEVGKSWTTTSIAEEVFDPCIAIFDVEVLGEMEVQVPAGTFSVFEVAMPSYCPESFPRGSYFLNREVGPVILPGGYKLVSVNGEVSSEALSWGAVKKPCTINGV